MSLYKTWNKAKRHPDWPDFRSFRDWTLEHGWKEEHGYKGEFTPESLKLAIPGVKRPAFDAEKAAKSMNLEALRNLAAEKGIELPEEADTKRKIAEIIAAKLEDPDGQD